ncbi:hypothetical protein [Hyalangium rubrum]|uniref:Uncharacterized protein n=1 Tax=Hyalangium rubrum TaxID=3103134 RepID=A0ABU5HHX0_9BACT|nr:hypothetical protein [Hyalangium sp. s54d21]MDY7231670.1 hypothetical protein [Hyalangium sp. s54d21]
MSNQKPPPKSRADKVYTALQGDDEFSVFSVDPDARKPMVDLGLKETVNPVATPLSRSIVRLFRKIFGS